MVSTVPNISELLVVEGSEVNLSCDPLSSLLFMDNMTVLDPPSSFVADRSSAGFYQCFSEQRDAVDSTYLLVACKCLCMDILLLFVCTCMCTCRVTFA